MKRREFLKGLSGIMVVPGICTAELSNIGSTRARTFTCFTGINFKNIKTNGTFNEWVESIRMEVKRKLISLNKDDDTYSVKIRSYNWDDGKNLLPAKAIEIYNARIDSDGDSVIVLPVITYFAFAKFEFEHKRFGTGDRRWLKNLVNTRFNSMLWSLEYQREKKFKLLRRFDPKHKTPDYYLH